MKKLTAILALLLLTVAAATAQGLHKVVPKDSKVYIQMQGNRTSKTATDILTHWGYWKIVDSKKDADFTMKIMCVRAFYAEFINKDNESIYTTKSVGAGNDEASIMLLMRKRIIKDKN